MISNNPSAQRHAKQQRSLPAVIGPRLRKLLIVVFALFGLLSVNSLYLAAITILEWISGELHQDYYYQLMFLMHLSLGLIIVLPAVLFGALHLRNAWPRPNYRAVRAGLALYITVLLLLASGLVLTRFDFLALNDPLIRDTAYWLHVITPLVIIWLFILHRLAGQNIRYRPGVAWLAGGGALVLVSLVPQIAGLSGENSASNVEQTAASSPYFPSLARTPGNAYLPSNELMMDQYCLECHSETHEKWSQSAHRFSSFNNPAYRFSVMETRQRSVAKQGNTHRSRFCAGCHDPVPLFSGAFDDPNFGTGDDPLASAGITCTSCHAITHINSPRGNADYTIEAPQHYPFTFSDNEALRWVNHLLVKAKPEFHKKTFLKPLHREPEFCGSCHKVHLPPELNEYKWLRGQNHQDDYHLSGVSGHGISSFYYPGKAEHNCSGCHMPLEASEEFGAQRFDESGLLKIHDHLFLGANTALPYLRDAPQWVNTAHRAFLEDALRIDIFGVKAGGTINSPLVAPLRPAVPVLVAGQPYLLEVVVRTLTLGHQFTQGTSDSNEVWLDVSVRSGDRIVGRSGAQAADGSVDPWSHFLNTYMLDREGNRIDRRNAEDIFTALYNHQIPPGASDVVHYRFTVPADVHDELSVEIKLNYRKFDTTYMRHIEGEAFVRNDLPVTTIAADQISFSVAADDALSNGEAALEINTAPDIPVWQRWNDYGIGLFRKGRRGEMRQAEAAFVEVETLGSADGPVNLARLYLKEGRLDDAAHALQRAAKSNPAAYPWSLGWFTGLVKKQNGQLDEAIADFKHLINTDFAVARERGFDFSQDYRLLNELAQTLVERSKRERGDHNLDSREQFLQEAQHWFEKTLALDPENVTAHYNLSLIYTQLGDTLKGSEHRNWHEYYRVDDNARDSAVRYHRSINPAADHAAEAVVIYDLQRRSTQADVTSKP